MKACSKACVSLPPAGTDKPPKISPALCPASVHVARLPGEYGTETVWTGYNLPFKTVVLCKIYTVENKNVLQVILDRVVCRFAAPQL